jgi:hypothetical protein
MLRRVKKRVKMVLSVRATGRDASGAPFNLLTHTLDIALSGVRIGGISAKLKLGDVVEIQRKHRKARFKVAWIGENGTPRTGHVGLEAVDPDFNIWDLELPAEGETVSFTTQDPKTASIGAR